jgi:hypothetical protein
MDAVQRVEDLTNMALDERTHERERLSSAIGALRIIREYKLLRKTRVEVAASILAKFTDPAFVEGVADRAEKIVSGAERVVGSVKKLTDLSRRVVPSGGERGGRRRRFAGR